MVLKINLYTTVRKCALLLLTATAILLPAIGFSQGVGLSNTQVSPNAAAMFDVSSGTGANLGLLIPRVTYAERISNFNPLPAAAQGLVVYQTDGAGLGEGLYYNTSTTTTPNWVKAGSSGWDVLGNSGTTFGTNFIGTTDAQGLDFRTNNAIRLSILAGGNVGIGTTTPSVLFAVNGSGTNVYQTNVWIENNLHVQGNEGLTQGGRGRLRVGTAWGTVGLYSDVSSTGISNDLILGASSGNIRIGPGGVVQKLLLPSGTGFQLVDNAAAGRILRSDASGNGTWQQLSNVMQVYSVMASQTLINSSSWIDVTGLTQTITLSQNSYVIIRTTGSLEFRGGAGTWVGTIVSLANNGTSLQEQGTDIVNHWADPLSEVTHHWIVTHTLTLTPGTYTFKVRARAYYNSGTGYYAGGATPTGGSNNGSMVIRVIPQ